MAAPSYGGHESGRAIYRPVGLDHDAGPSAIPYGSSQGWILNGNLQDFFTDLAISPILLDHSLILMHPTVAVSISAGYRSCFPHILILSVAK